jgi:hypothetical protein
VGEFLARRRIGSRPIGREHLVEFGDYILAERSEPSARLDQIVNCEHARAASSGQDHELVVGDRLQRGECLGGGEQRMGLRVMAATDPKRTNSMRLAKSAFDPPPEDIIPRPINSVAI